MAKVYHPFAAVAPSRSDNTYILSLTPIIENGLAAVTSANELVLLDRQVLSTTSTFPLDEVLHSTSCLSKADHLGRTLLCAGADGTVASFDVRSQKKVAQFKIDRAITTLACQGSNIAIGTELRNQEALVSVWDARQNKQLWQNAQNHDDITTVSFHPNSQELLLAGGDDGLVSLFNTSIAEEEDSLVQAINHGPIHRAGFLGDNRIYALSSDQNFAIHAVATPGDEKDPDPTLIGDLRPLLSCQYVIDVLQSGDDIVVAAGTNMETSRVDLVRLLNACNMSSNPTLDTSSKITIQPAHGEEVVRAIVIDDESGIVFTAGEDGYVRASRLVDAQDPPKVSKSSKNKKPSDGRYKPY